MAETMIAMWTPGPGEMLIILVVAVLIWGRRLPEIARSMGKSMTEFKKGLREAEETRDQVVNEIHQTGNNIGQEAPKAPGLDQKD